MEVSPKCKDAHLVGEMKLSCPIEVEDCVEGTGVPEIYSNSQSFFTHFLPAICLTCSLFGFFGCNLFGFLGSFLAQSRTCSHLSKKNSLSTRE